MKFELGPNVSVFMETYFTTPKNFTAKENVVINSGCHIDNRGGIYIGSNVSLSPGVSIVTGDHDVQRKEVPARFRPVVIEDDVFVGFRAVILGNVTIGRGAVICAGAVVTKNVEAYQIVAGVPARAISQRNAEIFREHIYSRLFS